MSIVGCQVFVKGCVVLAYRKLEERDRYEGIYNQWARG